MCLFHHLQTGDADLLRSLFQKPFLIRSHANCLPFRLFFCKRAGILEGIPAPCVLMRLCLRTHGIHVFLGQTADGDVVVEPFIDVVLGDEGGRQRDVLSSAGAQRGVGRLQGVASDIIGVLDDGAGDVAFLDQQQVARIAVDAVEQDLLRRGLLPDEADQAGPQLLRHRRQ